MKKHLALALGLMLLAVAIAGCGKSSSLTSSSGSTSGGNAAEQSKVNATLASDIALIEDSVSQDETPMDFTVGGGGFAAVRPYRWWREVTNVDRTFDTQFSDPDSTGRPTRALVTVNSTLTGTFHLLAGDTAAGDTTRRLVEKPFTDLRVRKLALIRVPVDSARVDSLRREWRVVGTSGVEVATRNGATNIQSLRVQAGGLDTTITNPLELWRTRRLLFLPPNTSITLTLTTSATDDLVFLRGIDRRFRFHPNGDGTFTASWTTGDHPVPIQHFGVEAVSRGTLFDDAAPYDANAWILPYAPRRDGCDLEHRR